MPLVFYFQSQAFRRRIQHVLDHAVTVNPVRVVPREYAEIASVGSSSLPFRAFDLTAKRISVFSILDLARFGARALPFRTLSGLFPAGRGARRVP